MECRLSHFPDHFRIRIKKENSSKPELINLYSTLPSGVLYQQFSSEVLQRLAPEFVASFSEQFYQIFDPQNTYVSNITIAVDFQPKIVYGIQANLNQQAWYINIYIYIFFCFF
jgi:hypothetical protein